VSAVAEPVTPRVEPAARGGLFGLLAEQTRFIYLAIALLSAAGIWAAWRHVYPVACGALGAYCNELVRAANGGRMPVEGHGMLSTLGNRTDTYVLGGPHTNFAWLDDRFQLPAPFPGIASAGDILIAVGMAWFVATLMLRPVHQAAAGDAAADEDLDAASSVDIAAA